jgi:hypothetical protein
VQETTSVNVPNPLPALLDDLNHAFNELAAVTPSDEPSVRRKLAAYLDALYTLREYRRAQLKRAVGEQVWESLVRKGHVLGGQQVEGHLVPRGNRIHSMIKMAPPAHAPLYPSGGLVPSGYLHPGENLTWMRLDELDEPTRRAVSDADKDSYFENLLAGLPVLPAADIARRCLIGWAAFGRLSDATYMASLRSAALAP